LEVSQSESGFGQGIGVDLKKEEVLLDIVITCDNLYQ
jgi:hypothetical protein